MSGYYRYYDSPDGQDFFKKQYFLCRRAMPAGCYLAWFDIVGWTKPTGVIPITVRFFQVFSPPLITVSLWNITTFMSTRLRGKDDPINHAIGVIPVAIYWRRFFPSTMVWALSVPAMLILYGSKQYKMWYPNLAFFMETTTYRDDPDNSLFADYQSYFWLAIKEKNWVTLEDAIKRGIVASEDDAKEKKLVNYKDGQARGLIRVADGSENMAHG